MAAMNDTRLGDHADSSADYVESVVRRSGSSFYWAMRLLPAEKRRAMFAIYAFCREVDDIADGPAPTADKLDQLARWRAEIDRLYGGGARWPTSQALTEPIARFGLPKSDFRDLIDGMETDAAERVRMADVTELDRYCDRVACAVGRLSNRVFGLEDGVSDRLAADLGQALQLTNILSDLHEDAIRDRLYLPGDLLRGHGATDTHLAGGAEAILDHPAVGPVCAAIAHRAQRRFEDAAALLATCDRVQVRPAVMMMEVYRRILRRLVARGWQRIAQPVRLSRVEKLWVALRYGMR